MGQENMADLILSQLATLMEQMGHNNGYISQRNLKIYLISMGCTAQVDLHDLEESLQLVLKASKMANNPNDSYSVI